MLAEQPCSPDPCLWRSLGRPPICKYSFSPSTGDSSVDFTATYTCAMNGHQFNNKAGHQHRELNLHHSLSPQLSPMEHKVWLREFHCTDNLRVKRNLVIESQFFTLEMRLREVITLRKLQNLHFNPSLWTLLPVFSGILANLQAIHC